MPNDKNLILNSERTPSELREIAKKGGEESGKARREKKQLKDMLLLVLNGVTDGKTKREEICASLINEALNGNVKAFEVIRDTIGEKPKDEVSMDFKNTEAQTELREYLQELKKQ